jgi:hypothetical protein
MVRLNHQVAVTILCVVWFSSAAVFPDGKYRHPVEDQAGWLESMLRNGEKDGKTHSLVQSYRNLEDRCWIYDQALAVIAFTALNRLDSAKKILETLRALQNEDGSFYFSYLISTLEPTSERTYTGTNAWVAMAVNFYRRFSGDRSFNGLLYKILAWMAAQQDTDPDSQTYGGLSLGTRPDAFSMEHNLDSFSAFTYSGNRVYRRRAKKVRRFILGQLYRRQPEPHFITGYRDTSLYLDCQSWAVLSLGRKYCAVLEFAERNFAVTAQIEDGDVTVRGFFERRAENAPVWSEGTEGMALAYLECRREDRARSYHREVAKIMGEDKGIIYATKNPHDFSTHSSVAGTAWYIFFELRVNPFKPRRSTIRKLRKMARQSVR